MSIYVYIAHPRFLFIKTVSWDHDGLSVAVATLSRHSGISIYVGMPRNWVTVRELSLSYQNLGTTLLSNWLFLL